MKSQTSLGKALRLLFAIGEATNPAGIGVAELMKAAKVSRPTAYRFLNELEQFGLVRSVPKQPMWQLGPKVIALAAQAGSWAIMRRRAKVAMEEFVQSGGPQCTWEFVTATKWSISTRRRASSLRPS